MTKKSFWEIADELDKSIAKEKELNAKILALLEETHKNLDETSIGKRKTESEIKNPLGIC